MAPRAARLAALAAALALSACARRPCRVPERDLAWPRERVAAALRARPGAPALARSALADLDRLAHAWTDARAGACEAHAPDLTFTCQDLARLALAEVARLAAAGDLDLDRAPAAILAARRLLAACDRPQLAALADHPGARDLVLAALALALARHPPDLHAMSPRPLEPAAPAPDAPPATDMSPRSPGSTSTNMSRGTPIDDLARVARGRAALAADRPDDALALALTVLAPVAVPFARLLAADARARLGAPAEDRRADLDLADAALTAALGPDHPLHAEVERRRGALARASGDDAAAAAHLTRALALLRAEDPDSDPTHDLALELGDLARVRGDLVRAQELHRNVLAHRQRRRGRDHLDTAEAEHALGADLEAMHRLDEAALHYTRAAEVLQARAPNDPRTARTYNNLGRLCYLRRDLADARRFHLAALAIRRAALGDDHPDTATSYNNLGAVDLAEGRSDAALEHFTRAREIRERVLGPDHPYLAVSLHNLAEVHALLGDLDQAHPLYTRALAIRRARFGDDHPETARTRHALGTLALARGDLAAAEHELTAALAAFTRTLGPDHPETTRARERLQAARGAATPNSTQRPDDKRGP